MRKDELRKQTRQELLETAKKLEIRGRSTMSKEELVDAIAGSRRPAEPKGESREESKPAPRAAASRSRKAAEPKAAEPKGTRAARAEDAGAKDEPAPPAKPAPPAESPGRHSESRRDENAARPGGHRSHAPRTGDDEEEEDEQNWNSVSLGRDPNYGRFLAPGSIPPRPGAPGSRRPANPNGLPRPLGDSLSDRSERGRMRAGERSHVTREDLRRSGDARRGSGYTQRYGRPQDARDDRAPGRGRVEQARTGRDARDSRDSRDGRDPREMRDGRGDNVRSRGDQRPGYDRRPVDRNPRDVRPDPRRSRPGGGPRAGMSGGMIDEGEVGLESRAEMILEAPRNFTPAAGSAQASSSDGYRSPAGAAPPPVRPAAGPLSPPSSLPRHYGIDRCRLMVRDPHCIHAYWEIRNETIDRARGDLAEEWDGTTRILRVHGIPISGDPNDPPADSFDIPLKDEESSYYVPIPRSNRGYRIDVGLLTRVGMFYPLASSNTVIAPRSGASPDQSESWATPPAAAAAAVTEAAPAVPPPPASPVETGTAMEAPAAVAIVESTGALRADFSGVGRMAEGVEVLLESGRGLLPSGPGIPPGAEAPTSPAGERGAAKGKAGKFWFVVNTELVIYGATEPDAKVTLQGKPVRLRSDGTFSLRFELPDGEQVLRAEAVSADGEFARVITPVVVRSTTSEERNPDSGAEA